MHQYTDKKTASHREEEISRLYSFEPTFSKSALLRIPHHRLAKEGPPNKEGSSGRVEVMLKIEAVNVEEKALSSSKRDSILHSKNHEGFLEKETKYPF